MVPLIVLLCVFDAMCYGMHTNEDTEKQNRPTSNVQVHYNETSGNHTVDYITTIIFDIDFVQNTTSSTIISHNKPSYTLEEENEPGCKCQCGVGNRRHRIVGGNETRVSEFPWLAAMFRRGKFYCAGALITKLHVLTAAHCVHGFQAHELRVVLGEHDRSMKNETVTVERRVRTLKPHTGFNIYSFNNDIAVLQLDSPVKIGSSIRPACLPEMKDLDYTGMMAIVAGWGRTEEKKPTSNKLMKVKVPIMSNKACRSAGYMSGRITENMMCAGYDEGKRDSCQGDSGGPMHIDTGKGFMEIAGIVSWGRGCARPNYPGVYTRVVNYVDWIKEQTGKECYCERP